MSDILIFWSEIHVVVNLLRQDVVAVGDELVPGLKEAEELDGPVALPLDDRVVLNHHCVGVHPLLLPLNAAPGSCLVLEEEGERCLRPTIASRLALSEKYTFEILNKT